MASIETWLLDEAMGDDDLLSLFESFIWRLLAAGLPLDRASLHVGTLHPQLFGFAWNWNSQDGLCDEVRVDEAALRNDAYRRNPLFRVIQHGETIHGRTDQPDFATQFPLIAELAGQGIVEYLAMPLRAGGAYHNATTAATKRPEGFPADSLAAFQQLLRLFSLHVERHIVRRISINVLDTYLGAAAGQRVLDGQIKRGAGAPIQSIIWASDLRGFTDLTDRLSEPDMILVLNAYFERLAGAVLANGGEVLKFIGDGLLAVFPFAAYPDKKKAAEAALAAAMEAHESLERLNASPTPELAGIDHWVPLRTGIALHEGEAFFGNVGAPDRLDFTVIGRSINATSRVEGLSKSLGRSILVTEPVASHLDQLLENLGRHALRGLAAPITIFSPR